MQMDNQAYQQHLDSYNNALNAWQLGYGVDRDRVGDIRYADETDYNRNQYERELALEQAMTMLNLGLMPSEELLTTSKMNTNDVQAIYEAIRAQLAADTKGKSGGGGGDDDDDGGNLSGMTDHERQEALFRNAMRSANPANYIASNYKKYGFTKSTGLSGEYNDWIKKQERGDGSYITPQSSKYSTYWGNVRRMYDNGATEAKIAETLQRGYQNGDITASEVEKMLYSLGIN
jgi:hypothetical protein